MEERGQRLFRENRFRINRFEELARGCRSERLRLPAPGHAFLAAKNTAIRERSRGFFELFPPRDGRFSFTRNEREAFPRAEPRGLRFPGDGAEKAWRRNSRR